MNSIYNLLHKTIKSALFYNILLILSLALISPSCSKDVLDKVPLDRFSDAAVWQDAALIRAWVDNTYKILLPGTFGAMLGESMYCDEVNSRRSPEADLIANGGMSPTVPGGFMQYWDGLKTDYRPVWPTIVKCNIFFDNIDKANIDANLKTQMIGEMKFLRAYGYFKLNNVYGGVPLITKSFSLDDNWNVPRNTYEECNEFILNELEEAIAVLPLTYPAAQYGRATKGAAMATKARLLLYIASPYRNPSNDLAKWQKAADANKAIIDLGIYSLYTGGYHKLFLREAIYNSEMIWQRPFNYAAVNERTYVEWFMYPNGLYGAGQCNPLDNFVEEYETLNGILPKDDPTYDPQNPYVNRDPRFDATIFYDGKPWPLMNRTIETFTPGGWDSYEGPISPNGSSTTGYFTYKYNSDLIRPTPDNQGNCPWTYFRYGEILLNYAECMYYLGQEATCRQYINMIRSRPGVNMPPVTESGEALLERYRHERKIELFLEEHRWHDVRRWKIAPVVLNIPARRMQIIKNLTTGKKTYTSIVFNPRSFSDKDYLLPIPQTEIEKNPLLVQNPGY